MADYFDKLVVGATASIAIAIFSAVGYAKYVSNETQELNSNLQECDKIYAKNGRLELQLCEPSGDISSRIHVVDENGLQSRVYILQE